MTTIDAAAKLGVSPRRVLQFIKEGRLDAKQMGGMYLIESADLKLFSKRPSGRPRKKRS